MTVGGRAAAALGALLLGCVCASCVEYAPKPRGYLRIEPEAAVYEWLGRDSLPFDCRVSRSAVVGAPRREGAAWGLNLSYPALGATLYCAYRPVTPASFAAVEREGRTLVARQARLAVRVLEKAYSNPAAGVYGSLFLLDGEVASPVQFLLTDSVSNFLRGALYFDSKPNADSLAPAIRYVREDIIELIQTFSWKDAHGPAL